MSLARACTELESRTFQTKACRRIRAGPFAIEIVEGYGALSPGLTGAAGRIAANRTSNPAEGFIVGIGGHVKD